MKWRFGKDVIDDDAFHALIGNVIVFKDGTKHRVDEATADAVRGSFKTRSVIREPQPGTRDRAEETTPSSTSHRPCRRNGQARASKAQARLPRHS